ncbi:MAG TPA: helix-turn-helix domain-containing protein [Gaiellaceae bacterium]|jgi:DNA-binding transcriptional ArsR family regulator|nr:helix-turn-helix domain-containing protein [Gaiellaceae bacterium]
MAVKQTIADTSPADGLQVLQALSDPVRLAIVRQLAGCDGGELGCSAVVVPVSKSTASHHFKALLNAGVIAERGEGTRKFFQLRRAELDEQFPGLIDSVLRATAA